MNRLLRLLTFLRLVDDGALSLSTVLLYVAIAFAVVEPARGVVVLALALSNQTVWRIMKAVDFTRSEKLTGMEAKLVGLEVTFEGIRTQSENLVKRVSVVENRTRPVSG